MMAAVPLLTTNALLSALRPDQTASDWALRFATVDWDDLAVRAIVLGLAPQLDRRVGELGLPAPPRAAAKLRVTTAAQRKRSEAIFAQLAEVLAACADRGLRPVALKGVHLAARVYAEPALRPMNDVDLLFRPEEMPAVEAMLADLGYGGKQKAPELGPGVRKHTSTFRRQGGQGATPNPYLSTDSERMIEPHVSLEESWFGLRVDITPGLRERAQATTLAGQPCQVLASEDLLLHLSLHFCFHLIQGAPAMVQLGDLLAVTTALEIDWDLFAARARAYRAAPYALAGLLLAQRLLEAPAPETALDELRAATPPRLRARVEALGLADILRRTQQPPLHTLGDRLRRGLADRIETARWAQDGPARRAVWLTLLRPDRSDTWQRLRRRDARETA